MDKNQAQKLLTTTKDLIAHTRSRYPKSKCPAFSEEIRNNIRELSHHFKAKEIVQTLSISYSLLSKAKKRMGIQQVSVPRFVEVNIPPSLIEVPSFPSKGKVILELKTNSGTLISIYE